MFMKEFVESLSLGSGAAVVAVFSAIFAWLLSYVRPEPLRWLGGVAMPLLVACVFYRLPVWLGSTDAAQYSAWTFLVIGVWFLAGAASSAIILFAVRGRGMESDHQ